MPTYLATGRVSRRIGTTVYDFRPGDPVVLADLAHVPEFVADGAVDFSRPLTDSEVEAIRAKREAEAEAERQAVREKTRAVSDHEHAWGERTCPGYGPVRPAGWTTAEDGPHVVDELRAEQHDGTWFVGCARCLPHLLRSGKVPTPPEQPDTTLRVYRVQWRYRDVYAGPRFSEGIGAIIADDGTVALTAGQQITAPAWLAQWLDRNSPGVVVELGPDGNPVSSQPADGEEG